MSRYSISLHSLITWAVLSRMTRLTAIALPYMTHSVVVVVVVVEVVLQVPRAVFATAYALESHSHRSSY
jgi:hypothetical protein